MVKGKVNAKAAAKKTAVRNNGTSLPVSSPAMSASRIPGKTKFSGNVPSCSKCGTVITEDTKALQCDRCQHDTWRCVECLNLQPEVYDHLVSDVGPSCNLRWFCEECDKSVMEAPGKKGDKIDCLIGLVEKMMEKFDNVDERLREKCDNSRAAQTENRIKDLEDRFNAYEQGAEQRFMTVEALVALQGDRLDQIDKDRQSSSDTLEVRRVVVEQVAKSIDEIEEEKEIDYRKSNIILYRVPEDRNEDVASRNNKDKAFVKDLLETVFGIIDQQGDISKIYRLGRWSLDTSVARPLLVGLSQMESKTMVMSNLRCLKDADDRFREIGISNDLTPKQRSAIKTMIADAKKDHADHSSEDPENFRFLVVGHGQKKRVIKIRKQS